MIASAAALISVFTGCKQRQAESTFGLTANLDTTVSAKTDFYDYACGGWMKANPLKPEYSRFGTFDELGENNRKQIRDLVEELAANENVEQGSNAQKIRDLYRMGLDSVTLNKQGAEPLMADLELINTTPRAELLGLLATMPGIDVFFGTGVEADLKNSDRNVMYWSQGGLGLGNPDYYTHPEENKTILEAYNTCLRTLATLAGYDEASAARLASNTMAIETELANKQWTNTQLRNIPAQYNPKAVADLDATYPAIGLANYFKLQNLDVDSVIVGQPDYYAAVNDIFSKADEQVLRDYFTASYLGSAAPYLSDDFIAANFALTSAISGAEQMQPRWKRALSIPNGFLGEALGELYVNKYFPASSKERMLTLVGNLQKALGQHIDGLTWMSDSTKVRAQEKLAAFTVKIGYPDKWRDYSALAVDPALPYWKNIQNAIRFNIDFNNSDYGKPVDRARWHMSPQTVNAYYNPTTNEICFPAGILQPPFFDPNADDAVNYGAIGVVIGHEMTHGFDDQGRNYDKEGNLNDWWTAEDAALFTQRADRLAQQYSDIIVVDSVHANGRFTLGENIADQGGLMVAHLAYLNSLEGKTPAPIDGFTNEQRFYLGYANLWAQNIRPEEILRLTKIDPHSLGKWRVNAALRNIDPFYTAFDIKEGDPMYMLPADRVVIW